MLRELRVEQTGSVHYTFIVIGQCKYRSEKNKCNFQSMHYMCREWIFYPSMKVQKTMRPAVARIALVQRKCSRKATLYGILNYVQPSRYQSSADETSFRRYSVRSCQSNRCFRGAVGVCLEKALIRPNGGKIWSSLSHGDKTWSKMLVRNTIRCYVTEKWGINVHFSNKHCNYYSAWVYVTKRMAVIWSRQITQI